MKGAHRAPIYRGPRNACLNHKLWFELTPTSHLVFLTQVLCIVRLILTKLLFLAKQLLFIYHYCKLYALDMLHLCIHRFSFTNFRLRPDRCYQNISQTGLQRVQVNCWRPSHVSVAGCWRDWDREELAGLAASNVDGIWVMREHEPWAILGAYKEFIRCVMLYHTSSYLHKN